MNTIQRELNCLAIFRTKDRIIKLRAQSKQYKIIATTLWAEAEDLERSLNTLSAELTRKSDIRESKVLNDLIFSP